MNIIAIIPARYASTRLPAKPLLDICGQSMIRRVFEKTKQSTLITDCIIATDDARIADEARSFGGIAVMTPAEIRSGSDRIAFAARTLNADIIVNVQGDEPLIDPQLIDETINALINNPDAAVSTAVRQTSSHQEIFNPNVVKAVLDKNNRALYFSRSAIPFVRDAKNDHAWINGTIFYKHFGLYVYRADFLQRFAALPPSPLEQSEKLEQLRILENGFTIQCVVTQYESFPVDTVDDLESVRRKIKSKNIL